MPLSLACSTAGLMRPLDETLAEIAAAGFRRVDLIAIGHWPHVDGNRLADAFEAEADRVGRALAATGLTPVAMNTAAEPFFHRRADPAGNARRLAIYRGIARLAARLGVRTAGMYPGWWIPAEYNPSWEALFPDSVAGIREAVDAGAAEGVAFVVEPHVATPYHDLETTRRLLDAAPWLGITYDPTHFLHAGIPLEETFWLIGRARHVHVRDVSRTAIHTRFGTGLLDLGRLVGELKARGYSGVVSIECLPSDDFDVRDDWRALRDALGELGVT
jgi:sugar phosphate isomerase/epimerase